MMTSQMNENNKEDDRNRKLEENLEKLKRRKKENEDKRGKPVVDENCVKSTSVGGSEGE